MKSIQPLEVGTNVFAIKTLANAADFTIDSKCMQAFINFKVQYFGDSWLCGGFKEFSGEFSYDRNLPADARATIVIKTASLDANNAELNKHLRSAHFFNVDKYPEITFTSTRYTPEAANGGTIVGNLTLHGVTRSVTTKLEQISEGEDTLGEYRAGFKGSTKINLSDFGIDNTLGPASDKVEITLSIEGIKN